MLISAALQMTTIALASGVSCTGIGIGGSLLIRSISATSSSTAASAGIGAASTIGSRAAAITSALRRVAGGGGSAFSGAPGPAPNASPA